MTTTTIRSLDDLLDALRDAPEADNTTAQSDYADRLGLPRRMAAIDWTSLPTFGGEEPQDTAGVWSWDATRLLVGTCADDLKIVARNA